MADVLEAERGGDVLETGFAAVAPHPHALAPRDQVLPAVVIVIEREELFDLESIEGQFHAIFDGTKHDLGIGLANHNQIQPEIVVQIRDSDGVSLRQRGRAIGFNESARALLGIELRSLRLAHEEYSGHVFMIPVLDQDLFNALDGGGQARSGGVILEIAIAEVPVDADALVARQDGKQVELAGEVEIGEHSLAGLEPLEPRGGGHFAGLAIGGETKDMGDLLAEHKDVLKSVVVQVANEHFAVIAIRGTGKQLAKSGEVAVGVIEQPKTGSLPHPKAIPPVTVIVQNGEGGVVLACRIAKCLSRGLHKPHRHTLGIRLSQRECHTRLRMFALLQSSDAGGCPRVFGQYLLVPGYGGSGFRGAPGTLV